MSRFALPRRRAVARQASMLTLLALGAGSAAAASPKPLALCYEDVVQRPWSMPSASGLNFELLKRVEKQLGEQFIFTPKPWRRCMEELRIGTVDGVIAAADARNRRSFAMYPTLPDGSADPARALYTESAYVFLRAAGQGAWDGQHLTAPNKDVAVQAGYLVGTLLRERGYHTRELVKSADDGLRLLVSGMFDVAVLSGYEAGALVRNDSRFQGVVQQAPLPYAVFGLHLAINRPLYLRDPQRFETLWRTIATVRASPEYRQLLAEAGVPE